jgi:hypothetical protein
MLFLDFTFYIRIPFVFYIIQHRIKFYSGSIDYLFLYKLYKPNQHRSPSLSQRRETYLYYLFKFFNYNYLSYEKIHE